MQALAPDKGGRGGLDERIRQQLNDGQVACVIDGLKPHRDQDKAIAACIGYFEANRTGCLRPLPGARLAGRIRRRESACKQIVGSRFKRSVCRWSKAGANALLAAECCLENNRWADFLDWRVCRAAAA